MGCLLLFSVADCFLQGARRCRVRSARCSWRPSCLPGWSDDTASCLVAMGGAVATNGPLNYGHVAINRFIVPLLLEAGFAWSVSLLGDYLCLVCCFCYLRVCSLCHKEWTGLEWKSYDGKPRTARRLVVQSSGAPTVSQTTGQIR